MPDSSGHGEHADRQIHRTIRYVEDFVGADIDRNVVRVALEDQDYTPTVDVHNVAGTIMQVARIPSVGELEGGTIDQVRTVDSIGGGHLATVYTLEDITGGTLDTVHEVETPRSMGSGTLAASHQVTGTDQKSGTFAVDGFDGFSLGIHTDGTLRVDHEFQMTPGGRWYSDGTDTVTGAFPVDSVITQNHKGRNYRPSLSNQDASGTLTVDIEIAGN